MSLGNEGSFDALIKRSEDYSGASAPERSAIRHNMIRIAEAMDNELLWLKAGLTLIRAAELDDLTPQVSDHFIENCPDAIFAQLPSQSASMRFIGWRKRIQSARGY